MKKIDIIYQTSSGPQTDFEFEYIENVIFKNIKHENHFNENKYDINKKNPLVIYSCDRMKPDIDLLNYLNVMKEYSLLHLSNEYQQHLAKYYKKAKVVFRTASWDVFSSFDNVYTLPLGFQSGFYNKKLCNTNSDDALKEKEYIWSFIGQIKNDRKAMSDALEKIKPSYIHSSSSWMSNDILSSAETIEIYKKTIFIPSPFGNINFECFRTMEALEWGCIPVTTMFLGRDCYKYIYGDHPFIVGKNWLDCANQITYLIKNPKLLEEKQKLVNVWYKEFRNNLASDVKAILSGELDKVKGKQFLYQHELRKDYYFKLRFFFKFYLAQNIKRIFIKINAKFNHDK
ncbi:TPA: hypothetical protein ACHWKK_001943 [Providencia stuartii]